MTFKFSCMLHGDSEGVRVAAVELLPEETVRVHIECMTCRDHIGASVDLPLEEVNKYDLPEIGSNIYNPLTIHLDKQK